MDELLSDLKESNENESAENNKALFTSISGIEKEMKKYEEWVTQTKTEMLQSKDLSLKTKEEGITADGDKTKIDLSNGETTMMKKDNFESLQKLVGKNNQEVPPNDYNDITCLRANLVNTTLTNLHILHQYRNLLNLVKDNYMNKPRKVAANSPRKPIVMQEIRVIEDKEKTEGAEPNSANGINPELVTPTSVQMGQGSFKDDVSKPTCDTEKDNLVQIIPET